ncbi:patatin-like phospholipase [Paraburkholderia sp. BL23I1N1]|uniref:patatin-like phospholipase family protein n=1 Tax=Paraburkholderia sp. BL23I1N1 TaxID=1938802 RepID=UPI000E746D61|nr:patatin-like phospholipase family protein [Paraburkholderia sp. BL23I1N1]RKE24324.1 patatin-like phospholipase [Paraburkholderia sp. BL23I1N1]
MDALNQRKLLAIDGGGIRGLLAVRVLSRIEAILRDQSGRPDLVLADYFDYIAGTSAGAILAAGLALGMSMQQLDALFTSDARAMFAPTANIVKRMLFARYDASALRNCLQEIFGVDTTLGSNRLRTLVMLVMLNARTNSPWPVSSNPKAKYNDAQYGVESNLNFPLWQLVRASTAAPYFFEPERIRVGTQDYLFYDGALSSLNNPAFKLFQMATLPCYRLEWLTGADRMLLVSVGTGLFPKEIHKQTLAEKQVASTLLIAMQSLMFASTTEVDMQCRGFARVLAGDDIDGEVGNLSSEAPIGGTPLFSYMRYNALLTPEGLEAIGCADLANNAFRLDDVNAMAACSEIGEAVGRLQVKPEHFASFPPTAEAGGRMC